VVQTLIAAVLWHWRVVLGHIICLWQCHLDCGFPLHMQVKLMAMKDAMSKDEICPECGMRSGPGKPNCAALRDILLARDFQNPVVYWKYHRLTVDAYCVQHQPYVKSAKSLAAHLCGLCVALELNSDPVQLERLQIWLSTNPELTRPELPSFRGNLTVADVSGIEDPLAYGRAVQAWATSAWESYGSLQPLARE